MIWLLPWFLTAVCINGQGIIEPPRVFGPFESRDEANQAVSFLAYGYLCESHPPYQDWWWTKATPIYLTEEQARKAGVIP